MEKQDNGQSRAEKKIFHPHFISTSDAAQSIELKTISKWITPIESQEFIDYLG